MLRTTRDKRQYDVPQIGEWCLLYPFGQWNPLIPLTSCKCVTVSLCHREHTPVTVLLCAYWTAAAETTLQYPPSRFHTRSSCVES
jgi:hypothetical protein